MTRPGDPRAARFDVATVGGGAAGVAAAVTAARLGARSLLVERESRLGGNASQAFVHTICGLYRAADEGDALPAHPGLPRWLAAWLRAAGAAGEPERAGRVWVLPTDPPRLGDRLAALCAHVRGLEVRTRCELVAVQLAAEGSEDAQRLALRGPGGDEEVLASVAVDASGDAAVAALGGAATDAEPAERLQIPSFIFRLGGVEGDAVRGFERVRLSVGVAAAARAGALPARCESVLVRPGLAPGEAWVTLNLERPTGAPFDPLDAKAVEALGARARDDAGRVVELLRSTRPAFRRARVVEWPARVGIRETRRVRGRTTVTREHVLEGRDAPDGVAASTWPIELWRDHRRAHLEHAAGACAVPLGALVSGSHPRLGMAGRCASATHEALGALRVIGTSLATGEAIGAAAARAADGGRALSEIEARDVRKQVLGLAQREGDLP